MFKRTVTGLPKSVQSSAPEVPDGLLKKCNACKSAVFVEEVKKNYYICPHCRNYFRVHAYRRVEMIGDEGTFEEWDSVMESANPMHYKGYEDKLAALQTGFQGYPQYGKQTDRQKYHGGCGGSGNSGDG